MCIWLSSSRLRRTACLMFLRLASICLKV
jgi:hypothetical protein